MVKNTDDVAFKLTCPDCGQEVPFKNSAADSEVVSCSCGREIGTAGDIRKAAKKVIVKDIKTDFRKNLKKAVAGKKGIKLR